MTEANPRQERITRLLAERYEVIEFLGEGLGVRVTIDILYSESWQTLSF